MKIVRWKMCFLWLAITFSFVGSVHADGDFKRFPSTISLNGAYVLAYGCNDLAHVKLSNLKEAPASDEDFDREFLQEFRDPVSGDPRNLKNYVVDLQAHRAIAIIPDFRYFPGRNHLDLEIGWSIDGREALAILIFRYGWAGVAWIEPRSGRVINAGKDLDDAFRRVLARREGKAYTRHARDYTVNFSDPVISGPGQFIVGVANAGIPKNDDAKEFDYRLKFKVVKRGGMPHFVLISARRGADFDYDQPLDNADAELATAFRRLRVRLHGTARVAFEREQVRWQSMVEALPAHGDRSFYTERRARELKIRLEEL